MVFSKENKDIAVVLALGAALAVGLFALGRVSAPTQTTSDPRPCHSAPTMEACVLDISRHNAAGIGVPASSVSVFCAQQAQGWSCWTSFPYRGSANGHVCFVSYILEGESTGIPVFVKNVESAPSACATKANGPAA